jgi:hypothetical protein
VVAGGCSKPALGRASALQGITNGVLLGKIPRQTASFEFLDVGKCHLDTQAGAHWLVLLRRHRARTSPLRGQHIDDEISTDVKWLKSAVEGLKAYYQEAMTAQPGDYDTRAQQA